MRQGPWPVVVLVGAGVALCAGCPKRGERSPAESADRLAELYEPVGLELLPGTEPVGTRDADRYDQLRVILALHDHQKDRTRGFGQFRFEIYEYRPASADRRGERWGVWNVPIESHKDLDEHWDPFNRMFEFRLDFQNLVPPVEKAVLEVTFQGPSRRLSVIEELAVPHPMGLAPR